MIEGRERAVAEAFVALATKMANGDDLLDMVSVLAEDCSKLLGIAAAGVLLADAKGVLHVLAASSEASRDLEIFQLQREQGPCMDCFRSGAPVTVADLQSEASRWPEFAEAAAGLGFASVHAIPMRLRAHILGALGLFGSEPGALSTDDLQLGQAFADVASVAIVQDRAASDRDAINEQLQHALSSRIVLEQAKGFLAQLGNLSMDDAFARLRRYSRDHNQRLSDVAERIVTRRLPAQAVLQHFAGKQGPGSRRSAG